jgi:ATP-dependent RNA helicase MSS116
MSDQPQSNNNNGDRRRNPNSRNSRGGRGRGGGSEGGHPSKRPRRANNAPKSDICFAFAKSGECARGDQCRFKHEQGSTEDGENTPVVGVVNNNNNTTPNTSNDAQVVKPVVATSTGEKKVHITTQRFADLPVSAPTKRAMKDVFGFEFMTVVQSETLSIILNGTDCLARAKTGTGKTLAFLIPAVEQLRLGSNNGNDIDCLVLSPTRELAFQIQTEAESLTKFHDNLRTICCVGGTNINKDHRGLKSSLQILVATPGRLLDHLSNGLAKRFEKMKILIFDECDQLLDQGFRPDLEKILKLLEPSKGKRQTLLFSATMPASVSDIANRALNKDYAFIDTVGDDEESTHMHVQQNLLVTPQGKQITAMEQILGQHIRECPNYKVIVFFTTARLTGFMADLFNSQQSKLGYSVLEIHSRKSQSVRQKASDKFRTAKSAVLFSSDVSARGMDYPDVTFVLQVGITERAQYIHRLGRTARAGKEGKGALLLADYEENWMVKQLEDMPLQRTQIPEGTNILDDAVSQLSRNKELKASAEQAYRAWLGFYNGHLRKVGWGKGQLVQAANQWGKDAGLTEQPALMRKTVGKMGLKGVPGLKIE